MIRITNTCKLLFISNKILLLLLVQKLVIWVSEFCANYYINYYYCYCHYYLLTKGQSGFPHNSRVSFWAIEQGFGGPKAHAGAPHHGGGAYGQLILPHGPVMGLNTLSSLGSRGHSGFLQRPLGRGSGQSQCIGSNGGNADAKVHLGIPQTFPRKLSSSRPSFSLV